MLDATANQGITARIRLVIVDRQPIVLQGLKSVLGAQHDFDVVASSSDRTSCLEAIRKLKPDVALLADTLPDLTVSEIVAIAQAEKLPTRLVFFTESDAGHDLTAAIAAGACSAISKYASPDTMLRSLRLMAKRGVSLQQSDLSPTDKEADGGKIEKMLALLTHRERQIVLLVSEGMSNKEIARRLNVSQGTVKVHLYNIFQKLEITNRTVLATLSLLQRTSAFSTLSLALLALAIADELKAAEANDAFPHDNGIGHASEHAEYEPWKKAILRHLIISEFSESPSLTQRDFLAKVGQVTNPAAAMEALRAAEQSLGSKPWNGPVGSSTLNLPAPLLRGASDTQIGGDPTPEHQLPRLASNPMSIHGGYANFAALAGALIYGLQDSHVAAHSHDAGQASIDGLLAVTGENATTNADATHVGNSVPDFLHESRLPSTLVTTGNESAAADGARSQTSHDAAGADLQKSAGLADSGHDASLAGYGGDQLTGGNPGENAVDRSPGDSNSTSSAPGFDFGSGASRINLAAFGALAWLHMTAAGKSVPPHTIAWIYDAASNETIVYVNATDHALDVGDRSLVEVHLQGIVSVAQSDVVGQPEVTAAAITLEQLEELLTEASATDETGLSTDNVHAIGGASESTLGAAGAWSIPSDDGLRFHFGQTRTGLRDSTKFRTSTSDSRDATEESDGASAVPAHVSSIAVAHSATATSATAAAVENPTSKSQPVNADTGVMSTGLNQIVATDDSTGRGNSHASETASAKMAAAESSEDDSTPGNAGGNSAEHRAEASEKTEHGNSGHSNSANAADAAEGAESDVATGANAGHGNSHASETASAKAAAAESSEADSTPGNAGGNSTEHRAAASETAQGSAKAEHGNSGHAKSANAADAAESIEPDVATAANADHGNSDASETASAKAEATESTEADSTPGNAGGNSAEHRAAASETAQGSDKTEHGNSGHANSANAADAAESVEPDVATAANAGHGNSHASEIASAKAEATESTEADSTPGNAGGNSAEHRAAASETAQGSEKTEHGNSGHANSANAADAAESVGPDGATAANSDHGNSDASETASAKVAATESTEADSTPGNAGGNSAEHRAEASDAAGASAAEKTEHGNFGRDLPSTSANAPDAAGIVDPSVATADGPGGGNSQHASDPASAKAAATQLAEIDSTPGNGAGKDNGHGASASDAAGPSAVANTAAVVEHGNFGHDLDSTSAGAPDAAGIVDPSVATADGPGGGNSQHASDPTSAKAAVTELAEADTTPGNGAGKDNGHGAAASDAAGTSAAANTAEPVVVEHGNSGHSTSADASDAAGSVDPSVATADGADSGNSQHAAQSAVVASAAAQPAKAAPETGSADQDLVFRFDSAATPSTLVVAVVEPQDLNNALDPHVPPGQNTGIAAIVNIVSAALDDHTASHGNSGSHHAAASAHHDLLI
ncbi:LuxR C-terminal-related transcriptional regulator [Bradyrhizobium sp. 14AA]